MNFGINFTLRNPPQWRRPDAELYAEHIDIAVLAEKLGYDHVWTNEHHFTADGWMPSQLPILAAIASRTERIRLGTGVLLLPFHNPVRVAEDAATVDILSNGRFDLGVGPGAVPEEFAVFGVPIKQRRPRMYEGLEIIKRCFSEECFSFKGKYYEFNNVRMTTKPVQNLLPLWIGATGEKALFEAGARGYHLVGGATVDRQKVFDEGVRSSGDDPRRRQRAILEIFHLARTHDQAWNEAEEHLHYRMTWHYVLFQREEGLRKTHSDIDFNIPPVGELRKSGRSYFGRAIFGSPDEVSAILERCARVFRKLPNWCCPRDFPGWIPGMSKDLWNYLRRRVCLISRIDKPAQMRIFGSRSAFADINMSELGS